MPYLDQYLESVEPGCYRVVREIDLDGTVETISIVCHSPAHGIRQLDDWQDQLQLTSLESKRPIVKRSQR